MFIVIKSASLLRKIGNFLSLKSTEYVTVINSLNDVILVSYNSDKLRFRILSGYSSTFYVKPGSTISIRYVDDYSNGVEVKVNRMDTISVLL